MSAALVWFIVGILLCGLEALHWAFVLLWFGIGALAASATALILPEWPWQAGVFAVVSLALLLSTRPLALRLFANEPRYTSAIEGLVGREATVVKAIRPGSGGEGQVQVNGTYWVAATELETPIAVGTPVRITRVEGTMLRVTTIREGAA